jgi:saccharopine dehydrogenase-like NADP-dependent oxidoreductase
MRVVVLGAGGAMGREAVRQLGRNSAISELVLADRTPDAAESVRSRLETAASAEVIACDVLDESAMHEILEPADLVVNCSGPFFRLGVPALLAAIRARTTYVDICDDPEPTIEMLGLDALAREAGVAAVVGMGASPGLSNLLAARAAAWLDTVIDCYTGWSLDSSSSTSTDASELVDQSGEPSGAVIHFMEQIHGQVAVVEGGELVRRPPLTAVELEYPGIGRGTGYVVGHPEPVTLHRSLSVTGRSANLVLVKDGGTAAFLRGLQRDLDDGRIDLHEAGKALVAPPAMRVAKAAVGSLRLDGSGDLPPLFALVTGTVDGRPTTVACHVTSLPFGMAGATSVPAALAAGQLLERVPAPGVHPPEAAIDADRLLADLVPCCPTPVADVDALAPVRVVG